MTLGTLFCTPYATATGVVLSPIRLSKFSAGLWPRLGTEYIQYTRENKKIHLSHMLRVTGDRDVDARGSSSRVSLVEETTIFMHLLLYRTASCMSTPASPCFHFHLWRRGRAEVNCLWVHPSR